MSNKNRFGQYAVLLPEAPTKSEIFASEELVRFFSKATGEVLAIIKENSKEFSSFSGKYLSVGDTALFKQSGEVLTAEGANDR